MEFTEKIKKAIPVCIIPISFITAGVYLTVTTPTDAGMLYAGVCFIFAGLFGFMAMVRVCL